MNANPGASAAHPRVGVGVLLVDELGRALPTLGVRPPEADCWSIVGGKLDFLEPLLDCAVRETLEEVGVEIASEPEKTREVRWFALKELPQSHDDRTKRHRSSRAPLPHAS